MKDKIDVGGKGGGKEMMGEEYGIGWEERKKDC